MLIVLEGCDGAGKTRLAKQLKYVYPNSEIIHCTRETPNTFEYFLDIIRKSTSGEVIIADRFCFGQFVYQEIEERKFSKERLQELVDVMNIVGAKIVFVDAPTEVIKHRLSCRGEVPSMPVWMIRSKYKELFDGLKNLNLIKVKSK